MHEGVSTVLSIQRQKRYSPMICPVLNLLNYSSLAMTLTRDCGPAAKYHLGSLRKRSFAQAARRSLFADLFKVNTLLGRQYFTASKWRRDFEKKFRQAFVCSTIVVGNDPIALIEWPEPLATHRLSFEGREQKKRGEMFLSLRDRKTFVGQTGCG